MSNFILQLCTLLIPSFALLRTRFLPTEQEKIRLLRASQIIALCTSVCNLGVLFLIGRDMPHFLTNLPVTCDVLTVCVSVSISFIATVLTSFCARSLVAETDRMRFIQILTGLVCLGHLLLVSNNMFLTLVCWSTISFLLWKMVALRDKSRSSARIILIHHLASDLLLAWSVILIAGACGTSTFSQLPVRLHGLDAPMYLPVIGNFLSMTIGNFAALCLVLSMSIKSALFPFHRWLLATLDAPTPLSGLLHAGIVNVSAILSARLFLVLAHSEFALLLFGALGFLSAVVGTLCSSTDSAVKRKLAYSTVGQMGFMCVQLATGNIAAAVFHLIAHGLFKPNGFLKSGSAIEEARTKKRWGHANGHKQSKTLIDTVIFFLVLLSAPICIWLLSDGSASGLTAMSVIIAGLALASMIPAVKRISWVMLLMSGIVLLIAMAASHILASSLDTRAALHVVHSNLALGICVVLFALIGLGLNCGGRTRLGQFVYVSSLNGFYVDELPSALSTWFNRGKESIRASIKALIR
jgi:NAD(P)H-quinone oxidoreductase subunit 5